MQPGPKIMAESLLTPPEEQLAFPLTVACVDMGSNAIRFVVARFLGPADYEVLAGDRRPIRLGHGVYLSGRLGAAAMDAAVAALADFRAEMDRLGVDACRAVATSAVREARNGRELVRRVRNEAGLELEAISGSEEARLVHLAVATRVPLGSRQWLLVDLGGGSVEVSVVDESGIFWSESHTMGSVRLLEELTESGADPGRFRRLLQEYVATLRVPAAASHQELAGYVATGGNIETLAKLGGKERPGGVTVLTVEVLGTLIERLARMSFRERVEELGLREDRADVVLPAAMVYERLAGLTGCTEILVPHVGIKEGVLFDLVNRLTRHEDHSDRQAREVLAGAVHLGRRYLFDEAHARHVTGLALSLFDQTRALHGLGGDDRRILQAAAMLHDIGQFVSYKGHHKHSLYLISNSELPTFSGHEMTLVASVARYHRKSEPADRHHLFGQLGEDDRRRVTRLSAILRLADSLDREHLQRIEGLTARWNGDELTLTLHGGDDLLLEGWALRKKSQLFSNVFGLEVTVRRTEERTSPPAGDP